jgi:hypothetical protein
LLHAQRANLQSWFSRELNQPKSYAYYSRLGVQTIGPKFFAPALNHYIASSFMSVINLGMLCSFPLKILVFRLHQIVQHTMVVSDSTPLAFTDSTSSNSAMNQSCTNVPAFHLALENLGHEAQRPMVVQIYLATGQS